MRVAVALVAVAACGSSQDMPPGGGDDDAPIDGPHADADPSTLSGMHPGDVGLGTDPAVIWFEDFEGGPVATLMARYDDKSGTDRMALAPGIAGMALALTAGGGTDAVDFFKKLPDADEWYVRWYAKYQPNVPWHHSGVWFGGYNPPTSYPNPQAGNQPNGNDRFSIAFEPVWNVGAAGTRFDTYNYWRGMHSWMDTPSNDGTSYYGNALAERTAAGLDEDHWVCIEVHAKLDDAAGAGSAIEVWKNDAPLVALDDTTPGYWVKDHFCGPDADARECTDYPPSGALAPPDLRVRNATTWGLNNFWPQNYITDAAQGTLTFDQMVVARSRIGCMQ